MRSYACQHGSYGTCSYCRVEAEEAKEIQRTQAQARIQELEGLVREMESDIRLELANILAAKRHLMELGEGNYIQESLSISCSQINGILNRPLLKSIMVSRHLNEAADRILEFEGLVRELLFLLTKLRWSNKVHLIDCGCAICDKVEKILNRPLVKALREAKPCQEYPPNPADNPAACLACMGAPGVEHTHAQYNAKTPLGSGRNRLTEFAVLKVRNGVPVLADDRYPEFVVVRREALKNFIKTILSCDCDCCTGECLDCSIGKAALEEKP